MAEKVVLACSSGLGMSIMVPRISSQYGMDVVAMIADVGQGEDLDEVVAKAYDAGAKKAIVCDLREELLRDFIYPTVRAGAFHERSFLPGTAITCPVIARQQVKSARAEAAVALADGCTHKSMDHLRFELAYQALAPDLTVIAPSTESAVESCKNIYFRDRNIWHIAQHGGELEDAGQPTLESTWIWTRSAKDAPDAVETVEIGFEKGSPSSVNHQQLDAVSLVELLNEIAIRNAVGRVEVVENCGIGLHRRSLGETPAGTLITTAHRELESFILDREVARCKHQFALKYAELVYDGLWFTPLREALDSFIAKTQENVTGSVKLSLYKGNVMIAGRACELAFESSKLQPDTRGETHVQTCATGFIDIPDRPAPIKTDLQQTKKEAID